MARDNRPGPWLKQFLPASGLTQAHLAQLLGISTTDLNKWFSGTQPIPFEYLRPLIDAMGATSNYQRAIYLLENENWRKRIEKISKSKEIENFGIDPSQLCEYIISLARRLASAELMTGHPELEEAVYNRHLYSAHSALDSVSSAFRKNGGPIFNPENMRQHVKFRINEYVAALINLDETIVIGGASLSYAIVQQMNDILMAKDQSTFLERLVWQHTVHVMTRYLKDVGAAPSPSEIYSSSDPHDRRMFALGKAFRVGAGEREWVRVFDEVSREDVAQAVISFDTVHYDNVTLERDGYKILPNAVKNTTVKYIEDLSAKNPYHRIFASKRLKNIFLKSSPDMLKDRGISKAVSAFDKNRPEDVTKEVDEIINIIRKFNSQSGS